MNILYVSPFSHGVNISPILNIAHLVANEGHNVHFFTVKTSYMEFKGNASFKMAKIPDNVHMHYIKNRFIIPSIAYPFINPIKEYTDLKRIIKENDIDLIHFNFPEHLICLPMLRKLDLGVPFVLSINGIPGYDWFYGNKYVDYIGKVYSKFISSYIIKKADYIVPLYSNVTNTLISLGFNENNIINVASYGGSYGVDTELFKPLDHENRINIREKYGLSKDAFILIYAGRLVEVKRLDLLIKIFKVLKSEINNAFLLIVGDGPKKEDLIKLSWGNYSKDIKFMDFVNPEILSEIYAASDIFMLISSGEGNPGSLMEACSSGLPAIVSDVGANSDIIQNDINGYVMDEMCEDKLIEKIIWITENYTFFSKNARIKAIKELSWGSIIENHINLYSNLVDGENK